MTSLGESDTVASLEKQYKETKTTLKEVENNIKRIIGRNPDGFNLPAKKTGKWENGSAPSRNKKILANKKKLDSRKTFENRETLTPEGDDSDEESPKKRFLQSAVVKMRDAEGRREKIERQKHDSRDAGRNRRMFGMVLGTLEKFQHEEGRRQEQSQKRAQIDKKVEEAVEKEREELSRAKEELFVTRKEKQLQMQYLKKKLEIAKLHEVWQNQQKMMMNFIKTKGDVPQLMYLPAKHNSESQKRLVEAQEVIKAALASRNAEFEKELQNIEEFYRKRKVSHESSDDIKSSGPTEDSQCVSVKTTECVQEEEQMQGVEFYRHELLYENPNDKVSGDSTEEDSKCVPAKTSELNFIKTKCDGPQLMYLPAKHNSESRKRLLETQEGIRAALASGNVESEKELQNIEECYLKHKVSHESSDDKMSSDPTEDSQYVSVKTTECVQEEEQMQGVEEFYRHELLYENPNVKVSGDSTEEDSQCVPVKKTELRSVQEGQYLQEEQNGDDEKKDKPVETSGGSPNQLLENVADQTFTPMYVE